MRSRHSSPRICVIGAGFGGVSVGARLVRAGIETFTVFEKSSGVGGVWHHNTYPGAEVDTPSYWYSLSIKQFDWPRTHARQPALEQYINAIVDDFRFRQRIRFNKNVTRVEWDDHRHEYSVTFADGDVEIFDVVVSAVGLFNEPRYPDWPGLDSFNGPAFHTACWEHEHDLSDKKVAVVGTGSTGVQVTTALGPDVKELKLFQRSPGWILPKGDRDYDPKERSDYFRPGAYRRSRIKRFLLEQYRFLGGRVLMPDTRRNRAAQVRGEDYIDSVLGHDPELRNAVTPDHPYMGKRPIQATGFYETLLRENVSLVRSGVTRVEPHGVVDTAGTFHECDVIVMATGFKAAEFLGEIELIGRDGREIHDVWNGEPDAFLGMTVPGFPNFYMLYGPNTNMGAITFNLETQAQYVVRDAVRMTRSGITSLEVRAPFHRAYNTWLQYRLAKTVWASTDSYFKAASGKLVVPFPTAMFVYWVLGRLLRIPSTRTRRTVRPPARTTERRASRAA